MHKDMTVLFVNPETNFDLCVCACHRRFADMKHYGDELQSVISQLLRVRAVGENKVSTAEYAAQSIIKVQEKYIFGVIRDDMFFVRK